MDVDGEIAGFVRVEVDLDNGLGIACDGTRDVGKRERTNLHTVGSLVGRHVCSLLGDDTVIQALDSKDTIPNIRKDDGLRSSPIILINNDAVEGHNIRIYGEQGVRRRTDAFQRDRCVGRELDVTLAGRNGHIGRQGTRGDWLEDSLETDILARFNVDGQRWKTRDLEVGGGLQRDALNLSVDIGLTLNRFDRRSSIDASLSKIVGGRAGKRKVDGRSESVEYTFVARNKRFTVSEYWFGKLADTGNVGILDQFECAVLRDGIVDSEVVSVDISHPVQAGSFLTIE